MNRNDQQFMVEKIRTQYMGKKTTGLDELRALDAKVKRPVNVFAYIFGSISAIIMGCGMSLVMTEIAASLPFAIDPMPVGIVIGCVGMILALVNYPIYLGLLNHRKKKYGARILELSERLMKEEE